MKKNILIAGDQIWGDLIGASLTADVTILDVEGACNSRISQLITSELIHNPDTYTTVCVMWTNFFSYQTYNAIFPRWDYGFIRTSPNFYISETYNNDLAEKDLTSVEDWKRAIGLERSGIEKAIVHDAVDNVMKKTEIVCSQMGANLYSMQGMAPFDAAYMTEVAAHSRHIMPLNMFPPWTDYLDVDVLNEQLDIRKHTFNDSTFIGWPLLPELGGYSLENVHQNNPDKMYCHSIVDLNLTPEGAVFVSNEFIDRIQ